jgi:hypothetical protein
MEAGKKGFEIYAGDRMSKAYRAAGDGHFRDLTANTC